MPLQELSGRFYITASNDTYAIGADAFNVVSGYYYTSGYAGESEQQLCEKIQAQIRTIGTQTSANVNYYANGRIVIALTAAANLVFYDTPLADIMGMNTIYASAAKHQGYRKPQYTWRPSRSLSHYPLSINTIWAPESTSIYGRSKDGSSWSVKGNLLHSGILRWTCLLEDEIITPRSGTNYAEYQQWWTNVIHAGQPFRIIPDRTAYAASNSYVEAMYAGEGESIGGFLDLVGRHIREWNGLWDVEIPIMKKI